MKILKFLAIAVCFAMCVPFIPAADIAAAAERVSFSDESVSDNIEVSGESETTTTAKKTTTTATKTTTKKTTTTNTKTTTKKTTTTTTKTTTKKTTTTTTKKTTTSTTKPKTTVTTTVKTTATESPYMLGDIDNDKKITGSDATRILREYTLISSGSEGELTQIQKDACDVDGDGKITGSDATLTLAYYTYQGSGGVLDFEDYMKYGPIDIQQGTNTTTTVITTTTTTTATSTATESTSATTTTTTNNAPDTVQEIKLSHYEVTLLVDGGDMPLVTMYPETAPDKSEKWWSSDTSIATVNYEGWIIGIAPGECTVTVQSVNNPDVTAEIKVTVVENKVSEIKLDKYEVRIAVGKGDMPLVTMYPETATDKSERWWSSDYSIATVNEEGWIVGVAVGECTVTVRSVNNPDVTAEIKVIVTDEGLVKEIVLDRYEVELTIGKGDMPLVTMLPADAEDKSEIWWSSDASVATVNYEGWIVGTGVGECVVTVQSAANPTIKAEVKVIVKE